MTVAELLDVPNLKLELLAGEEGLGRPLAWAHVCEMPDPTGWLNGGELVLSTGMALSRQPTEQCDYLRRLHAVDAGAVLFGDTPWAKELSHQAREVADSLPFPVLWAPHEVPYISVVRAVVERSEKQAYSRMQKLQSAYELVRDAAYRGSSPHALLDQLARLTQCDLSVLELPHGNTLFGRRSPEAALRDALVLEGLRLPRLPAVVRLPVETGVALALPINGTRPAVLLAHAKRHKPDTALLQHVATMFASELEKLYGERERQRRLGAELLGKLLDQTIDGAAADQLLASHDLGGEPRVVAVWRAPSLADQDGALHHRLAARGIAHLLVRRDLQYALVSDDAATLAAMADELVAAGALGVSWPLGRATRVPDAAREARIALKTANLERRPIARYGEGPQASPFVPRSVSEAAALVDSVLGSLRRYDAENNTELLPSLRCFLRNNRKWQKAAADLHVHKQTVHYRMRRVEELTGRRLDSVGDIAALWYAVEAEALLASDSWAESPCAGGD